MKGHIPDIKIEEIKNRANIVDLVSDYVTLKKAGRNFVGLCPFHKEKTPSFTVTPDRQMFYCFGCGEGGNIFAFMMKINQMTYPEAVRHLAKKTGVVITEQAIQKDREESGFREQLIQINEIAANHYVRNLTSPSGKEAMEYLRQRGLRDEIISLFRLGVSLSSWRDLRDFLEKGKASLTNAEKTGLLIPGKDASLYDRFRGRLMFPIEDLDGHVIAFGGRIVGDGEPKYLNSPESPVYSKGKWLYALNRAREAIRKQGYVILVEGYFDLISLWNAGITHVVATLGTALTKDQIELIGRYTKEVVVLFDPDEAGRKALVRSLELFLAGDLTARALVLPEGLDPDDYVRTYGGSSLLELVNGAPSIVDYYIDHVLGDQTGFEGNRESLRKATTFIKHIENTIDRNLFIKRVSEKLGVDQELLKKEISHARSSLRDSRVVRSSRTTAIEKLELNLIYLLLIHPEAIINVTQKNAFGYITNADLKKFGEELQIAVSNKQLFSAVEMVSHLTSAPLRDELMKKLTEPMPAEEEKMLDRLISDTAGQIRRRWYKEKHRVLAVNMLKAQENGDLDLCERLLMKKERLLREERTQEI